MSEKKCINCGKAVDINDKFCPSCGQKIGGSKQKAANPKRDHYVIIGILAIVVLVYFGYMAFTPTSTDPAEQARPQESYGAPADMSAFIDNLPPDFSSLVSMGNALMDQGNYEMATECYSRALDQKPEDVAVRVDLGTCQHSLGFNQKAIDNFTKALEYDPAHSVAKYNLGIVHFTAGENEKAVEWWNKLLSENPSAEMKARTEDLLRQAQNN